MTEARFRCSFIRDDSSVVPDTLMDLFLNLILQSIAAQNAHYREHCSSHWMYRPIPNYGPYGYRRTELSFVRNYHQYSHHLTTKIESQIVVVLWCSLSMELTN